jgi:hypothetical protein
MMGFDMLSKMPAITARRTSSPPDVAFAAPDRRHFFDTLARVMAQVPSPSLTIPNTNSKPITDNTMLLTPGGFAHHELEEFPDRFKISKTN